MKISDIAMSKQTDPHHLLKANFANIALGPFPPRSDLPSPADILNSCVTLSQNFQV